MKERSPHSVEGVMGALTLGNAAAFRPRADHRKYSTSASDAPHDR